MKAVLSLAVFSATVFGLVTFVTIVTPGANGVVQTAANALESRIERPGMPVCRLNLLAAAQDADVGKCDVRPDVVH